MAREMTKTELIERIWVLELIRDKGCKTQAEIDIMNKAIELMSRSKGKWIDNTCSVCGYTNILNPYALVEKNGHVKEVLSEKFCSNCGSDMREE